MFGKKFVLAASARERDGSIDNIKSKTYKVLTPCLTTYVLGYCLGTDKTLFQVAARVKRGSQPLLRQRDASNRQ